MNRYWPHLIIDRQCYHCNHIVSSYQHEFYECGITPQIWAFTNSILDQAQLPARLPSLIDLPEFLYDAHNPTFNLRRIVNTNLIILALKAIWDAYQSKKEATQQQYRADIRRRIAMYFTNEIKQLQWNLTYKNLSNKNLIQWRAKRAAKMAFFNVLTYLFGKLTWKITIKGKCHLRNCQIR